MTVYPDLAFLLGLAVHGAVFFLSLSVLNLHRPWWQTALCSIGSGVSSALILIPHIPIFLSVTLGVGLMLFLLRGKSVRGTVFNLFTGFIVLILYLGIFMVLSGGLLRLRVFFFDGNGYFLLPFPDAFFAVFLTFCIGVIAVRVRRKHAGCPRCCDCEIVVEGKVVPVRCYVDTADFLTDPVSGLPVAIMEYSVLRRHLGSDFPQPMTYEFAARFSARARVIPYRSVSGDGQMLSAFVPELFLVNGIPRRAVVAVSERRLERRGRFSGIIGPELLGGE